MPSGLFRPGDRPWLHFALLALTLGSVFTAYFLNFAGPDQSFREQLTHAAVFSGTLVLILGAHEMGHYLMSRYHRVDSSLPYFIPLPLLGFGTLGAVIRIRDRIPHRNALVDIGAAGPLAGLAVAIPALAWGLHLSAVVPEAAELAPTFPGRTSLWVLIPELINYLQAQLAGTYVAPPPAQSVGLSFGMNLLTLALQDWVVGPLAPGMGLRAHPLVIAGWFGLLVTMLNLVPVGQLDGGHLSFALLGRRARPLGRAVALGMVFFCTFFTVGWVVWLVVTSKFIGFGHPEVSTPTAPLSRGRKWICAACAVALVACVMPVPLTQVTLR